MGTYPYSADTWEHNSLLMRFKTYNFGQIDIFLFLKKF